MRFLVLATLVAFSVADEAATQTKNAFLLASKFTQSMYAVENMELVVEYGLYNTGDKPATKVHLNDAYSFPTNSFEIVQGNLNVRFDRIAPGANITHTVIVKPLKFGVFNYTAAQVMYTADGEPHVGYSNAPGEGYIYRLKEYERKFSPKYPYWIIFVLLISPTTLGSFLSYYSSKTKYEEFAKKKL